MTGSTYVFNNPDGFILKLNACGEKEWCTIYKSDAWMDYSTHVHQLVNGGYIMDFHYWGNDLANKRIWLFRLDGEGNTIWKNLYATDTSYINEEGFDMIIAPDSGYIISGENWYEIDTLPGYYYEHPFFIKVNNEGSEEWEESYWPDSGFWQGSSNAITCDNYGNIYSTGYRGNYDDPIMIKMSSDGEQLGHVILLDTVYFGITSTIDFLSDSSLVLGGYHGHANGLGTTMIWKVDREGNKLDEKDSLLINVYTPADATVTFDDKTVFVVTTPYTYNYDFDIVMYKLNSDLEYDSIYNQPFEYDYLCPHPIVPDTIDLDCSIVVNMDKEVTGRSPSLIIIPNPANSEVSILFPEYYKSEINRNGITSTKIRYLNSLETKIEIYDLTGSLTKTINNSMGTKEIVLNVEDWNKGMYLIRLTSGNEIIGEGKMMVQ
jgi:hypothetical protein